MKIRQLETLRLRSAMFFLAGLMAFVPLQLRADGSETLGTPSISIASGTNIIANGTGLIDQPGIIEIDIPADADIKQVLLYWEGFGSGLKGPDLDALNDPDIIIEGNDVIGTLIGGPNYFFHARGSHHHSSTFRADITDLNLVSNGLNALSISGLEFDLANNGAGIMVIIDDGSGSEIQLVDGDDTAFINFSEPRKTTIPQAFVFASSSEDRTITASMFFGSVSGATSSEALNRPSTILVTIDGIEQEFNNLLSSTDGEEWDTLVIDISVPAEATSLTIQAISEDRLDTGELPASLVWIATGLSIPPAPEPVSCEIKIQKTCDTTGRSWCRSGWSKSAKASKWSRGSNWSNWSKSSKHSNWTKGSNEPKYTGWYKGSKYFGNSKWSRGSDSCVVPHNGGKVVYRYRVKNTGETDVDVSSVIDDKLGEQMTGSPVLLAPGEVLNLRTEQVLISETTTNTVLVDASVAGNSVVRCAANDAVTVTVKPKSSKGSHGSKGSKGSHGKWSKWSKGSHNKSSKWSKRSHNKSSKWSKRSHNKSSKWSKWSKWSKSYGHNSYSPW